ncbi:hypothetical protein [Leptolyngbya ohadii]|uniref:hypothetical protein n=1 Tax=Leptolyngbya ohadii TaxID=1962290 RepID=UPI000B59F42A|nr:hypothetical protein [Leptolyngbya ohadii]
MLPLLKTLLDSIVDYAGLYPPAQLDLRSAMQNYAQYAATPHAWMLSRFVLPAARLEEFTAIAADLPLSQWSLSVVVKDPTELEQAFALQTKSIKIAALEFTPQSSEAIQTLISQIPSGVEAFFEIPLNPTFPDTIALLKGTPAAATPPAAKLRTGGITESAFPNRRSLADWICTCAQANVPFKATAGLHHPFPGNYRLTYELDSPIAPMQGFLNVAIASAFAYSQSLTPTEIIPLLEIDSFADLLELREETLIWHSPQGKCQIDRREIQIARQQFFRSFGSCSFEEPIEDLIALDLVHSN